MIKCKAVGAVSELLKSKCKHIVIAVLRAQVSFLSNSCNLKHPTNNTFVVLQVNNKNKDYQHSNCYYNIDIQIFFLRF